SRPASSTRRTRPLFAGLWPRPAIPGRNWKTWSRKSPLASSGRSKRSPTASRPRPATDCAPPINSTHRRVRLACRAALVPASGRGLNLDVNIQVIARDVELPPVGQSDRGRARASAGRDGGLRVRLDGNLATGVVRILEPNLGGCHVRLLT